MTVPDVPRTIAVVNRGDAAQRALQAIRDDALERGVDHRVVVLHTDDERHAPWVLSADVAVDLGPALQASDGGRRNTYLDHDVLERVLLEHQVDAAWVGWGLVSESPTFARLCEQLGVTFLGPPSQALEALGDKGRAKSLAVSLNVPVAPWSGGPVEPHGDVDTVAGRIGYPLMVKASAGGGGRGIRVVEDPADLDLAVRAASDEAAASFGDPTVILERLVERGRHLEVQAVADRHGAVAVLGMRDCTLQRRRQKVVEEGGPGLVSGEVEQVLVRSTRALLGATSYVGLATVEFLLDVESDEPYFMEVNPRLQVEHTVTEEATGLDLVRLQLHVGLGGGLGPLSTSPPPARRHAVQARVAAVDPSDGHRPAPGRLVVMRPPTGPGIRVDTGLEEGLTIPSAFDPLVAKVIAVGDDREHALARLRRALDEFELVVTGGATNLGELRQLVSHPVFRGREHDVAWLDRVESPTTSDEAASTSESIALLLAGVALAQRRRADARRAFEATRRLGSLAIEAASRGETVVLPHRGANVELLVAQVGDDDFAVTIDGRCQQLRLERIDHVRTLVTVGTARPRVASIQYLNDTVQVDLDGRAQRFRFDDAGIVRADAPGVVVAVSVDEGDEVAAGDVLIVVESMKLEMSVSSPVPGVAAEIAVVKGVQVDAGDVLVIVEGASDGETSNDGAGTEPEELLGGAPEIARDETVNALTIAQRVLGGWDTGPLGPEEASPVTANGDNAAFAAELDVVERFTQLAWLTSRDRGLVTRRDGRIASHIELFHAYLRSPDRADEVLPPDYHHRLSVVADRFGIDETTSHSEQGRRLHRLARAVDGIGSLTAIVESLLRVWLHRSSTWGENHRGAALRLLDELAAVPDTRLRPVTEVARVLVTELAADGAGLLAGMAPTAEQERRYELWRYRDFELEHLAGSEVAHTFLVTGRKEPADRRLVTFTTVDDLYPEPCPPGVEESPVPGLESMLREAFRLQSAAGVGRNERTAGLDRVVAYVQPPWTVTEDELAEVQERLSDAAMGLGLEKVLLRVSRPEGLDGPAGDRLLHLGDPSTGGAWFGETEPSDEPVRPLDARGLRLARLRQRGLHDPSEIIGVLTSPHSTRSRFWHGTFVEFDLLNGELTPVDRPLGLNECGVVVGLVENHTRTHPNGMQRVIVLGDPGRGLGSLGEAECRRILAALDLAAERSLPVEWFALSAGARVSMDSGTENLDWVARVLRRIIEFTQAGGEINVVVTGINVGAQPYFNAESTMLMHTAGILVMLHGTSMVLTGKRALDFAGGVSADDEVAIGGYEQIMGPNGQAQFGAASLEEACGILFAHYEHTYVAPGDKRPREQETQDVVDRDVTQSPHPDGFGFTTVGDIFDDELNPDRKRPFDMRSVMSAVIDVDCTPLERWRDMADAEGVLAWEAHVGGVPVALLGLQAHSQPRLGMVPPDGPRTWSGATLFPKSSKKLARALNAASGRLPAVVLASLSGFDGSPESLRELQLEYGAEIGRAVTNFDGRIVFCVVSRYHGGAFVVFSRSLHDDMEVLAVEGSRASVIGGSAAAAVVFRREVERRVRKDPRVLEARRADPAAASAARVEQAVRVEIQEQLAREFDDIHSVERALEVGSVDCIVRPTELRGQIARAISRPGSRSDSVGRAPMPGKV